jgi:hypothetical protein
LGGEAEVKIHYSSRWLSLFPPETLAFTLGEHVFVRGPTLTEAELAHEFQHVRQFRKYGVIGFIARYFWYNVRGGYRENPIEKEARVFALKIEFDSRKRLDIHSKHGEEEIGRPDSSDHARER